MRKILFFSKRINNYLLNNGARADYIIDYYDIEVQKVLNSIGFSTKLSPNIYDASSSVSASAINGIFDLDNHKFVSGFVGEQIIGVVFSCK